MTTANIRQALETLSHLIAEQPAMAVTKNVPATARLLEGLRCEVKGPNGESAYTDMPPTVGGTASAPSPGWLFRASLASCTTTTIALRAARLGIALTTLEVTAESDSDHRGLLGLDDKISASLSPITIRIRIGASGITADQLRELALWGDRHSPIACTARSAPNCSVEVEVADR